jgi:hypothetical protein
MSIAVAQSVKATGSAVTSLTSPAMSTTSGNLLVADFSWFQPSSYYSSMSDSLGQTWFAAASVTSGVHTNIEQDYSKNITGNASFTVTLNLSGSGYPSMVVREVSGADTSSPLDRTATVDTGATTSPTAGPTGTTSQANEMLLGFGTNDSGVNSYSVSTPWTQDQEIDYAAGQIGTIAAHQNITSIGTPSFSWRLANSAEGIGIITTWKEAAASAFAARPPLIRTQAVNRASTY